MRHESFDLGNRQYSKGSSENGIEDNESISALHSPEHFGLGRYGDPVDPEACFKAFQAIQRKTAPGGNIYISMPVGEEYVGFNTHRAFYPRTSVEAFAEMELENRHINEYAELDQYDSYYKYRGMGLAGLFHFRKPKHI